jgi:hypothetical protein
MRTRYSFVTRWELDAPLPAVYDLIAHPLDWPRWWRAVVRVVELEPGDADGLGHLLRFTWRTQLPYGFTFDMRTTRVERHRLLEAEAQGDLQGTGRWTFDTDGPRTRVRYDWNVETTKRWMRIVAPLARPAFAWNHDVVMGWGLDGLRAQLVAAARIR